MQWFTRVREAACGSVDLGRIAKVACSTLTFQAALTAAAFGQQGSESAPEDQAIAASAPAGTRVSVSPGVCASYGVPGLTYSSGCLTSDGYNPARIIVNRSTPEGGWAVYGSVDSQGNPTVCAGPSVGLQWGPIGASVTPSACVTYRRDGSPAQSVSPGPAAPAAPQGYDDALLDRARQNAYQQMLNQVRNDPDVYNNPFAANSGSPANQRLAGQQVPVPPNPNPPADGTANTSAGMTTEQYRANVNQSMQQFRQADASFRQGQTRQFPASAPENQSSAGGLVFDESLPRNANTTRANTTSYSYDENAARSAASGPLSRPSQSPVIPNVSQRTAGTQSQTAALQFPGE